MVAPPYRPRRGLPHFNNHGDQDLAIFTKDGRILLFRIDLTPEPGD